MKHTNYRWAYHYGDKVLHAYSLEERAYMREKIATYHMCGVTEETQVKSGLRWITKKAVKV